MAALKPGEIVVLPLPGAVQTKIRPAVVLSTVNYQEEHADLIVGVLTSRLGAATTSTDYVLQDWEAAGLNYPSAFRAYVTTQLQQVVLKRIGRLSERDWREVKVRVRRALEID